MKTALRFAHIGLLDSAPLLVAEDRGFFAEEGLVVTTSCELGLATVCGKLLERRIDGAVLPAPLPVMLSLGAGAPKVAMQVAQICALQGAALVMAAGKGRSGLERSTRLGAIAPGMPTRLLFQRIQQLRPEAVQSDSSLVSFAASQLVEFLREAMIDGFIGPDPLPALARLQEGAEIVVDSGVLFAGHPAGVLAVRAELVEAQPRMMSALLNALSKAREWCADPAHGREIWRLVLAQPPYAALSADLQAKLAEGGAALASTRFDVRHPSLGLETFSFLENACRGAIGPSARGIDLKAEIQRVYAPCLAADAGVAAARSKGAGRT